MIRSEGMIKTMVRVKMRSERNGGRRRGRRTEEGSGKRKIKMAEVREGSD